MAKKEKKMGAFDIASWVLCTIGALNWGFVGALDFNAVDAALGAGSLAAKLVYVLVGLGGLLSAGHLLKFCKK